MVMEQDHRHFREIIGIRTNVKKRIIVEKES